MAIMAVVTLAFTARFARGVLQRIDAAWYESTNFGLFVACMGLFFLPVFALSTFGPQNVQYLATRGMAPGLASGVVYGVSTLGNIAGVMLTASVLVWHLPLPSLLLLWVIVALAGLGCLVAILRSGSTASLP